MPKIISAQEAKKLFLSEDFPKEDYFVIDMKNRPNAMVLELKEHIKGLKKDREALINDKKPKTNFRKKIKNKLKESVF